MDSMRMRTVFLTLALALGLPMAVPAQDKPSQEKPGVPEDLLDDEHFREEMGINELTTPSIRKIFDQLADLGPITYEDVQMQVSAPPSEDRVGVALHLGTLIANGFLSVQCERFGDMEALGKAVLDHAQLLGTGKYLRPHSKSLLEKASLQKTDELKKELVRTQRDIEREMADLRDVDIAHLVSLGGWIRAFQVGSTTVNAHFTPESAAKLARTDITGYYLAQLENLHPNIKKKEIITSLIKELGKLQEMLDTPQGVPLKAEQVAAWTKQGNKLLNLIAKTKGETKPKGEGGK